MSKEIVIRKAKLEQGENLVVEYTKNTKDGPENVGRECSADPHPDLLKAFGRLSPHLARLCDQYDKSGALSDTISMRGITIKGEDEKKSVILTGVRTLANNKVIVLNTPLQRFGEEGEEVGYEQVDDLLDAVENVKDEVCLYLFEDKHAPNPQGDLFNAPAEETAAAEA